MSSGCRVVDCKQSDRSRTTMSMWAVLTKQAAAGLARFDASLTLKLTPVCVVAFDTAEHWAEDASEDIARKLHGGSTSPGKSCRHRSRLSSRVISDRIGSLRCGWPEIPAGSRRRWCGHGDL